MSEYCEILSKNHIAETEAVGGRFIQEILSKKHVAETEAAGCGSDLKETRTWPEDIIHRWKDDVLSTDKIFGSIFLHTLFTTLTAKFATLGKGAEKAKEY